MAIVKELKELRKKYPVKTFADRDETAHILVEKNKTEPITVLERLLLLWIIVINFHDSGKIEGAFSCDSSCHGCSFCQKMCKAALTCILLICGYCYDHDQEIRRPSVLKSHNLNRYILSNIEFSVDEWKKRPFIKTVVAGMLYVLRINSSGDIENLTHAINMVNLAYANPHVRVGFWAKNVKDVEKAFDIVGKPDNLRFIQSSPMIGFSCEPSKYADLIFVVCPDEETVMEMIRQGGVPCNGKKCKECGWKCYLPEELGGWAKGSIVVEFLRCTPAQRARILQAYWAERKRREAIKELEVIRKEGRPINGVYDIRKHPERDGWFVVDGEIGLHTYQVNSPEEARLLYWKERA